MTSTARNTLLFLCGSNSHGQLGMRGNKAVSMPRLAKEFCDVRIRNVWCGAGETLVVGECGRVWKTKGDLGGFGEIILGNKIKAVKAVSTPLYTAMIDTAGCLYVICDGGKVENIELPSAAVQLEAGALFVVILLQDGSVYSMGMNLDCLQLGYETPADHDSSLESLREPRKITSLTHTHVLKIASGSSHTVCLTSEGNVIGWGSNSFGELGFEEREAAVFPPKRLDVIKRGEVSDVAVGDRVTFLKESETGHVKVLGRPRQGSGGPPPSIDEGSQPSQPHPGFGFSESEIETISTGGGWGNSHTLFATKDRRVYSLGSNSVGQLGSRCEKSQTDTPIEVELPYQLLDIRDIKLSAGWVHSAILLTVVGTPESNSLFVGANGTLAPLPLDVLELVMSFLHHRDLVNLGNLCQALNTVYRRDCFWQSRAKMLNIPPETTPIFDHIVELKRRQAATGFFNNMSNYGLTKAVLGLFAKTQHKFLWVGLDASGKTTMLYRMKLGEVITSIPTIGFNVETVETKTMQMTMWDVGGPDKLRPLWRHYFQGTDAVVFMIDSNDRDRMDQVEEELTKFANEPELSSCAFLVFANKQDLPRASSASEISAKLDLPKILKDHPWHIQASSATKGDGIFEGFEAINHLLKKSRQKK